MREILSDGREEGTPDRWESSYNTPKSDRGKFYKFVSRILNIGHAKEEVFLMNEQSGISYVKILPSSLFKHLL